MAERIRRPSRALRFDGATMRHVSCARCGYDCAGIEVEQGTLTCPECGLVFPVTVALPAARSTDAARIALIAVLVVAPPAIGALLWALLGSWSIAAFGVIIAFGILLAVIRSIVIG